MQVRSFVSPLRVQGYNRHLFGSRSAGLIGGLLLLASTAFAQNPGQTLPPTQPTQVPPTGTTGSPDPVRMGFPPRLTTTLTPRFRSLQSADLENSEAGVGFDQKGFDVSTTFLYSRRLILTGDLTLETNRFRFRDFSRLVPGMNAPLENGTLFSLSPGIIYNLNDRWGLALITTARSVGDEDADRGKTWEYGGIVAGRYVVSPKLAILPGILYSTQLEDSDLIIPIVNVEWEINNRSRFDFRGPSATYGYQFNPAWNGFLRGTFEFRNFRLAEDAARAPNGVFRYQSFPVEAGVEWRRGTQQFSASIGFNAFMEYRLDDRNGNEIVKRSPDPSPFFSLTTGRRF